MDVVLINPPAEMLGTANAILTGRATRYYVPAFPGPLSVKSVISGAASWSTSERFTVTPGECLLLNDGQIYDITIESRSPVHTFCVFFERGFVESACKVEAATSDVPLLDDPWTAPPVGFYERLHRRYAPVMSSLAAVRDALGRSELDSRIADLAGAVARSIVHARVEWNRTPGKRAATRAELYRRLIRGREYLESEHDGSLAGAARAACLSTYHFHRLFTAVFGETPHRMVMRRRRHRALQLLTDTDSSVTEISAMCGFTTASAFATAIRQQYGASPTQLRKNRKG